jgi:flagellar motility protein MotE (MotC chaperone)
MTPDPEADMTSIVPTFRKLASVAAIAAALGSPAFAEDRKPPDLPKAKAADKIVDPDAARYCASAAPSIVEARIAWQTKRLAELDGQIRQRIVDLGKAESAARDWIARREAMMNSARDEVVAIYAKMEPESAAQQIAALDDRTAAAILAKLKPTAAGAILGEMDADRASRLASLIAAANPEEKKS